MNAPFTPGMPDDVFLRPHQGEARVIASVRPARGMPFIGVTVDGMPFRVYYQHGQAEQVHVVCDDVVLPGLRVMDCTPQSLHGQAVTLAAHLLAGIRRGEGAPIWPAANDDAPALPFWRWALSSVGFAAAAMVLIFVVIILGWALRGDR